MWVSSPSQPAKVAEERDDPAAEDVPPLVIHVPAVTAVEDAPPVVPPPINEPKRERVMRPAGGAVTTAEAQRAAHRALPGLRNCKDALRSVTADLDIVHGHGMVTALNLRTVEPDDPRYPWHACAKRSLEAVRFPVRATAGHAQVRLTLR